MIIVQTKGVLLLLFALYTRHDRSTVFKANMIPAIMVFFSIAHVQYIKILT